MEIRRTLRQTVRRAKHAIYRVQSLQDAFSTSEPEALMPPAHLRRYYLGTTDRGTFRRHCEAIRSELTSRGLQPTDRVLDIGSGLGNLPISLIGFLQAAYDGLDVHPQAVAWCQHAITPRHPRFRFHLADVKSEAYNPGGRVSAAAYRLPFEEAAFDVVFLASVFTHMLPDEIENYLREIGRVLAPSGWCVASFFLLNDTTRPDVDARRSFMSFDVRHASPHARLHDAAIPEAAVAMDESFVRDCCEQADLVVRDIRRGGWASGITNGQDVVTIGRAVDRNPRA
jgi:SAM-dependent methyltransferase